MKKFLCAALAATMLFSMSACGGAKSELALVTDKGTIDDKSFNQGAWEGLVAYADENNKSNKYYQPTEQSDDAYLAAIDNAVTNGAKVVVTPGYLFEVPIYKAQSDYPDVKFILLDGTPHDADYSDYKTASNTVAISYAEEQAGYLAGYAAVKDGYRSLGFMGGMAVPAVIRYGYGFLKGADDAAVELGLAQGDITVNYHYTGDFAATPETQTMAASWYQNGVEVVFACGGAVGNSVMAAASVAGKYVIGVDVDQSSESGTVITSAMKGLKASVYDCVKKYYNDAFPGGQNIIYDAANDGVSLAMDTAKFNSFTQEDYDAVFGRLAAGSVSIPKDTDATNPSALTFSILTVNEI
ncbi:MAG: BMP family ABC transporter substrate-binding protein [Clostridiales bacterium]|jgi:basic membrane protein A|nr:BMP family ABC transporter substrate-binding protein [Clostridiales bacterium]